MNKEILLFNYWEHFKAAKDLALVLAPDHPRMVELNNAINDLSKLIHSH